MPRGDRTGPAGMGSMTGRGLGYCAGYNKPGYLTGGLGMGMRRRAAPRRRRIASGSGASPWAGNPMASGRSQSPW